MNGSLAMAAVILIISALIGYGLYKLVRAKKGDSSPLATARTAFAFSILFITPTTLSKFFLQFDVYQIVIWLACVLVFGGPVFICGFVYGKLFNKNKEMKEL